MRIEYTCRRPQLQLKEKSDTKFISYFQYQIIIRKEWKKVKNNEKTILTVRATDIGKSRKQSWILHTNQMLEKSSSSTSVDPWQDSISKYEICWTVNQATSKAKASSCIAHS